MKRKTITMDGNYAAAHASYAFTEVAAIYPITPSTPMAEATDKWAVDDRKNLFGQKVKVTEMQSEAGAAGAVHGALTAGALTTTYTASQGLLLMIPNLYRMAGEKLPGVFHVAARTVATHALSIFGDHSDIYACRQTGCAMLSAGSVQEVMDLAPAAHLAALEGNIPFIHFFDGFRTSHEIQKVEAWEYEQLEKLLDYEAVDRFRSRALNPNHSYMMGSAQNPDVFFQMREAANGQYDALPGVVQNVLERINSVIGTDYRLFNYYGAPDAEHVVIAMGSVCETIEETIDYLNARGEKTGLVRVHLYRPFHAEAMLAELPDTTRFLTVLDRTKEPGAPGEPLYLDVLSALKGSRFEQIPVFSGRYGLASRDTTPAQIAAVFHNREKKRFTIGITDDVTHLSLVPEEDLMTAPEGTVCCKFWGLGSDGTVGANKNSIKIIGNHTDMQVQAYFEYDSRKSGGVTMSHLRFGKEKIKSAYLVRQADFVACHNSSYIGRYKMAEELKDGGTFLLNCPWKAEELEEKLPPELKKVLADRKIRFFTIDAAEIGRTTGMGPTRVNTILQSAFFSLSGIIPYAKAEEWMKETVRVSYGHKGTEVLEKNFKAIEAGAHGVCEITVPESWRRCCPENGTGKTADNDLQEDRFRERIQKKIDRQEGHLIPVSDLLPYADGSVPAGTSSYEKREIAYAVPEWRPENCIQCNFCSYVCPHAVIRPVVMTEEEARTAPEGTQTLQMNGMPEKKFAVTVSVMDCTGCGSCANVCPGKKGEKALVMKPYDSQKARQKLADYARNDVSEKVDVLRKFRENTVKGSQFRKPLLEFHGACAGCGETPYARLITQLYGERMYIANATGCSSIWGNSFPSMPYIRNQKGRGPAWGNSLFEDNAEFGYGMLLAQKVRRAELREDVEQILLLTDDVKIRKACENWLNTFEDGEKNQEASDELAETLEEWMETLEAGAELQEELKNRIMEIVKNQAFLSRKSQWLFGGDGWAYDIGFGGLDHVLASGEDINILVFNTQIYSNTGGQASKATPAGAAALLASGGKRTGSKDLAAMAMTYGTVYVAQIAMGADYQQTLRAITEAERYPGPSLIIAYAPCISHGIKKGMNCVQEEEKLAVETGYWHLFRYQPSVVLDDGTVISEHFELDSKPPVKELDEFMEGEIRYTALALKNPENAKLLQNMAKCHAERKLGYLQKLKSIYNKEYSKV